MRRYIFSILFFCVPLSTTAQFTPRIEPSDYIIKHWSTKDGLPVNFIADIHQTKDGFIWIATSSGLVRFDGAEFKLFLFTDHLGWPIDWITKLYETPDSTLWAYSRDGKLAKLRNGGAQFKNLDLGSRAISLIQREDSVLIARTEDRVLLIQSGAETPQEIAFPNEVSLQLQEAVISTDSTEYLASRPGLFFKHPENAQYEIIPEFSELEVTDIKNVGAGRILVASEIGVGLIEDGLYTSVDSTIYFDVQSDYRVFVVGSEQIYIVGSNMLYIYKDGRLYPAKNAPKLTSDERYNWIVRDRHDVLWINISDGVDSRLIRLGSEESEEIELDEDVKIIRKLIQDHEGNFWLATTHGLFSLVPRKFKVYSTREGLPENQVFSVEADPEDNVWAGTWGGGAAVISYDRVLTYSTGYNGASNYIRSSFIAPDQKVWFGTHQGVALSQDGLVVNSFSAKEKSGSRWIHSINTSPEGIVYVATNQRLLQLIDGQFENVSISSYPKQTIPYQAFFHSDSTLYLTTNKGLFIRKGETWKHYLDSSEIPHNNLSGIFEDNKGRVFIGSNGGGLIVQGNGIFKQINKQAGLATNIVHSIIEDNSGNYWLTHDNGVSWVTSKSLDSFLKGDVDKIQARVLNESDGLLSAEFSTGTPAITKTSDGRLWFATHKGVAVVDPQDVQFNKVPPTVQIIGLETDGESSSLRPEIKISYSHNNLEFTYSALSYSTHEQNRYKHRLIGLDDNWSLETFAREARYPGLAAGNYTFEVLGSNSDGVWSSKPASYSFRILSPYYATWWFIALGSSLFFSIVTYTIFRFRERQIRIRENHKRQLKDARANERERISKDLHEGIKSKVSSVRLLLGHLTNRTEISNEDKEQIEYSLKTTDNLLQDVHDTVWLLDSKNDSLEAVVHRVMDITQSVAKHLSPRIEYPQTIPNALVESSTRRNLLLIYREALINALKHSGCSSLQLRIGLESSTLSVRLSDDGIGFDTQVASTGHGLENLRKRIREIGGRLDIKSDPGKGTSVEIVVGI